MTQPQWFDYGISQPYGVNGERGEDIKTPFHTPITALFGGEITRLGYYDWGGEVDVLSNVPGVGPLATTYYLHLDEIESTLHQGSYIQAGQVIGLSGGENPLPGQQGYVPGGLHPAQPKYSSGPHTEFGVWTGVPWAAGSHTVDPKDIIAAAANGTLNAAPVQPMPNAPPTSATSTSSTSDCGTMPAPWDVGNFAKWVACQATGGLDIQGFVERGVAMAAGVALIFFGLSLMGRELTTNESEPEGTAVTAALKGAVAAA